MKLKQILNNRKGFTLMEIIVVLIIIAVLAAALIPSFVGFIRDSRSATAINEARMGMNAIQVLITEGQGQTPPIPPTNTIANGGVVGTFTTSAAGTDRFNVLVGPDVPVGATYVVAAGDIDGMRISGLVYTGSGFVVTIANGRATAVAQTPAPPPGP